MIKNIRTIASRRGAMPQHVGHHLARRNTALGLPGAALAVVIALAWLGQGCGGEGSRSPSAEDRLQGERFALLANVWRLSQWMDELSNPWVPFPDLKLSSGEITARGLGMTDADRTDAIAEWKQCDFDRVSSASADELQTMRGHVERTRAILVRYRSAFVAKAGEEGARSIFEGGGKGLPELLERGRGPVAK